MLYLTGYGQHIDLTEDISEDQLYVRLSSSSGDTIELSVGPDQMESILLLLESESESEPEPEPEPKPTRKVKGSRPRRSMQFDPEIEPEDDDINPFQVGS